MVGGAGGFVKWKFGYQKTENIRITNIYGGTYMTTTVCRLCKKNKNLLKKSHIVPEFFYKRIFDENHKIRMFSPNELFEGKGFVRKPPTGEYESNLLCLECDRNLLGSYYENYASKAIFGGLPVRENPTCEIFQNPEGIRFTTVRNISYKKFKIFLLSMLWRASISTRPFFQFVNLGPHEEIIRDMIYNGEPGELEDYPIFIMTLVNDTSIPNEFIATPREAETMGYRIYNFFITGLVFMFFVNSKNHKLPKFVLERTIKPTNEMNIIHIPKGKGIEFFFKHYGIQTN